jgi:hypothetical protein
VVCTPLPDIPLQVMYDPHPLAQRDDPLSRRGGWASAVPRGCRRRYVRYLLPARPRILNPHKNHFDRSTPGTVVHSKIDARHVFVLSGRTPGPATEHRVERRGSRMASPSGVDHGPRTKRHGCRERSAARSGSSSLSA